MWRDSETELDYLDFNYLIETAVNIIQDDNLLPATIGIYGDWGSGKSSLISMSMATLEEDKNIECIYFNGWLFEDYEDAKTALLGNILDTIEQNRSLNETAKECIRGLYKSIDKMKLFKNAVGLGGALLTGSIANLTMQALLNIVTNCSKGILNDDFREVIRSELTNKELREDITAFRKSFEELLTHTKIDKLVVFIDELDRCSPDTILDTLEAIRLFLYTGRSVFVIGADERHISYAVQTKFKEIEGIGIDIGKEYLEKIIQYPIRIPRLSTQEVEQYICLLFMEKELSKEEFEETMDFIQSERGSDFLHFQLDYALLKEHNGEVADTVKESLEISKQLASVLAKGLNGNPRHCKRFLNAMEMRLGMAKSKGIKLDRKILAKIMMLEYFKPRFFEELVNAPRDLLGSIEELHKLENDDLNSLEGLTAWQDDPWLEELVKTEPLIGTEDLRPYFYFARTSLENRYEMANIKLSKTANDVLKDLLSGTQTGLQRAIDKANDVNDYEAGLIVEHLNSKIASSSEIPMMLLKALLKFGALKKELNATIIRCLEAISGFRIEPSHIEWVREYGKETGQSEKIDRVFDAWVKDKQELKLIIDCDWEGG